MLMYVSQAVLYIAAKLNEHLDVTMGFDDY
jgi:hypothetical protein